MEQEPRPGGSERYPFYGEEREDVASEIPNEALFIVDVARPSKPITEPVAYDDEEQAEKLIEQIDEIVK